MRDGEGESGLDVRGARVPGVADRRWRSARPIAPVIWRLYNNGMGGQANHRYLTSHSEIGDMIGRGWLLEGPVFCTPP